jgi:hypothetical protein
VKADGTKAEILPAMMDAEARGVFKGPPVHNYYLKKAAFNSDIPGENMDWGHPPKPPQKARKNELLDLQKEAKKHGVAGFGMTKEQYKDAIEKAKQAALEAEQAEAEQDEPREYT